MKLPIILGLSLAAAAAAVLFTGCGDNTPLEGAAPCAVAVDWSVCDDAHMVVCQDSGKLPTVSYVTGCTVEGVRTKTATDDGVGLCVETCPGACTKDCPPAPPAP